MYNVVLLKSSMLSYFVNSFKASPQIAITVQDVLKFKVTPLLDRPMTAVKSLPLW